MQKETKISARNTGKETKTTTRKAHYFIVAAITIDGFIAKHSGHKSDWTSKEDKDHLHKMETKADVYLFARKTFDLYKELVNDKQSIVLTTQVNGVKEEGNAIYLNPKKTPLRDYVAEKGFKEVCNLGGRGAYDYALQNDLADDIYLTIEPIIFGSGLGMFSKEIPAKQFMLISSQKLNEKGTLLLHYKRLTE